MKNEYRLQRVGGSRAGNQEFLDIKSEVAESQAAVEQNDLDSETLESIKQSVRVNTGAVYEVPDEPKKVEAVFKANQDFIDQLERLNKGTEKENRTV